MPRPLASEEAFVKRRRCRIKCVPFIGISPNTETTGAAPTSPNRGGSFFLARRYGTAVDCCAAQGARLS